MKIVFASCCRYKKRKRKQPAWTAIAEEKPDLLLLLGDIVYTSGWDRNILWGVFRQQFKVRNFANLLKSVPYLAIWDDHDFGPNNAMGGTYHGKLYRKANRSVFQKFLPPKVRHKAHLNSVKNGIYCSYIENGIRFIMLDTRYYRDKPGNLGSGTELLGSKQEDWLWDRLEEARADDQTRATVVCSGSTINSVPDHGKNKFERIAAYPAFLNDLSAKLADCPTPIFLAGDIHANRIVHHQDFVEVISSGVAQKIKRFRDGKVRTIKADHYGVLEFGRDTIKVKLIGGHEDDQHTLDLEYSRGPKTND